MKCVLFFIIYAFFNGYSCAQSVSPTFGIASNCGTMGNAGATKVNQLVTYGLGGYYITGSFSGAVTFGLYTKTSAGQYDVFVAKVDAAGNYQWVATAGWSYSDMSYIIALIAVDTVNTVYITGRF